MSEEAPVPGPVVPQEHLGQENQEQDQDGGASLKMIEEDGGGRVTVINMTTASMKASGR